MIPASTLKIVTTTAALKLLGPDFRYETKICLKLLRRSLQRICVKVVYVLTDQSLIVCILFGSLY